MWQSAVFTINGGLMSTETTSEDHHLRKELERLFMKRKAFFFSIVLLAAGCTDRHTSDLIVSPPGLIWVGKYIAGGRQCDTSSHYTPPDTKNLLNSAGIPVLDAIVIPAAVCLACGCPTYAATHYALIPNEQLREAERLGFQPEVPPAL